MTSCLAERVADREGAGGEAEGEVSRDAREERQLGLPPEAYVQRGERVMPNATL